MNAASDSWVLVAGGFHSKGGMDRLNMALARHLMESGNQVHLVCHSAEPSMHEKAASVHIVPKPACSFMLGELLLARRGRQVTRVVTRQLPGTRVVVNGGNCAWPDINWAHCVHHAWGHKDESSPPWFKLKNHWSRRWFSHQERRSLRCARIVIANSERTRRELIAFLQIDPARIHTVYPGTDPDFAPPTPARRATARAWLGKSEHRPLVAFVGALGYDDNKGLHVVFSAWRGLCSRSDWDADLVVAGDGRAREFWQRQVAAAGLGRRITLLGFTDRVAEVLAAADLLVSPVRYESYGLNVHEAICCGVPAMVTQSAGVAERYPSELRELLIRNPEDSDELVTKLLQWRTSSAYWKEAIMPFSRTLRAYSLDLMAQRIVSVIEPNSRDGPVFL